MAHHIPTPLPGGFRRRFPLELSPDEYERLEQAARTAGSKRAALLLGLDALKQTNELQAALTHAEDNLEAAHREIATLTKTLGQAKRARAEAGAATDRSAAKDRDATEKADIALTEATQRMRALEQSLRAERRSHEETLDDVHALRARAVDELHCPRCGQFADHTAWAAQNTPDGALIYHKPCGYHRGGLLETTSVLGRKVAE